MSEPALERLLAEFVERREGGEALDPERFLEAHPEGGVALRQALHTLLDCEDLLPSADPGAPTQIGAWRVERELGRGGTGRVFLVEHEEQRGRCFALKLLSLAARFDERALERLRREGTSLQRLDHPDVVRVHEAGVLEGTPYLVLDYVAGDSLAQRIARARESSDLPSRTPWEALGFGRGEKGARTIARLVARVARAVEAVHRTGLLHRDLKPANLVLRADGSPVLIDFGLVAGVAGDTLTASGDVIGTPAYMAPEQARGERCDARTDVYGLGAILYELICLHPPQVGADALSVLDRVRRAPAPPPHRIAPALPRELDHICRRALAFRRERRFATVSDLALVLERYAGGERSLRATLSWSARLEDLLRRNRRSLIAGGLAALLLLSAGAWFAWYRAERRERIEAARRAVVEARFRADPSLLGASVQALAAISPSDPLVAIYAEGPSPTSGDGETWVAVSRQVEVALREGQGEAAREQAEHLLELRPGDALATGLLGLACKLAADDERALRELTAAARALPMASSLHAALGELHRRARRHAESARSYRRALELDDGVASWWYDLARAEAQSQQAEAGSRAIDRALALAGDGAPTEYWRTKAALLDELGRELEAIPLLQRLTQLQPSVRSYYSLGRVYDELCRLAEARDAYEAARTLEPRHVATLVSLANLYSGSNRTSCARCAAAFAADPGLLDPQAAERCALDYLRADRARLEHVVHFAGYLRRVDRTEGFRAELESELRRATSDEVLGRLLRAQRELAESRAEGR